jgi:hypothetical protein
MNRNHRSKRFGAAVVGFTFASLIFTTGMVLTSASALATPVPENGTTGLLSLDATPYPFENNVLSPGDRVYWPITANLNAPTDGTLTMTVTSTDGLATDAQGLRVLLRSCPVAWVVPPDPTDPATCSGGAGTTVIADTAFASLPAGHVYPLGGMSAVSQKFFLASLSLSSSTPARLQGEGAEFIFNFSALGDTDSANPNDPGNPDDPGDDDGGLLASTGISPIGALFLASGLLLGAGSFALLRTAQRRREGSVS